MNTVYVSSTYIDLAEHRQALKIALERAGFDVGCMEKYPAFDERPADKCLKDVAECDYYVLILAWRFGFQPTQDNPGNLSITRLEYDQAVRLGKRPLVFLLDEDHPWTNKYIDKDDANIQGFRDHVGNEHGRALFRRRTTSPARSRQLSWHAARKPLHRAKRIRSMPARNTWNGCNANVRPWNCWAWPMTRPSTCAWVRSTCPPLSIRDCVRVKLLQVNCRMHFCCTA